MYETIKTLHILLAGITGLGLLLRIFLVATNSQLMTNKVVTLSYAAVDALIIFLGIYLVIMIPNKEFTLGNGWLAAKLAAWTLMFATVFYGVKIAKKQAIRIASVCAGFVLYLYIIAVAHHHSPLFL